MIQEDLKNIIARVEILEKIINSRVGYPLDSLMKGAIESANFNTLKAINMIANRMPTDLSSSRAKDIVYQNGPNNSILVMATFRCAVTVAGGNAYVQGKADSLAAPTTVVTGKIGIETGLLNEDASFQIIFIVPAGANYTIVSAATNGTVTLGKWFEVAI